ncbi:Glutamyl-tRNA(Gln) amidotransferase subunit C, mitochondrial [Apostichopus japonicus]|uniref:Glutamyl-tRNA(Gln) amidotransferase subunit C, mitochondrial n=1 Tax=Stichopus japonicus TaxID=307972 RepID=A0A2G8KZN7_STIJA|nr:Glutamyl-tRNA(Gln) amidotransferase subunit C, mitochondrial [Apostichopus japonicus]
MFTSRRSYSQDEKLHKSIPAKPTWHDVDRSTLSKRGVVDDATVELLERLSLVNFNNQAGVKTLMDAVALADTLQVVDTTGVVPMDSVLEDRDLNLRDDIITDGNCKEDVMRNAALTFEDYFVAPPGNIPLETKPASRYRDPDEEDQDKR